MVRVCRRGQRLTEVRKRASSRDELCSTIVRDLTANINMVKPYNTYIWHHNMDFTDSHNNTRCEAAQSEFVPGEVVMQEKRMLPD